MVLSREAHQLDRPAQALFEQFGECKEPSVGLCAWRELDDEIDIAPGMGIAPQYGPEEGQAHDAQSANLLLAAG